MNKYTYPILSLLLAGCGNSSSPPAAPEPRSTAAGVMRHLEGPAYEPMIAITPAGNIFYSGGTPENDPAIPGQAWVHGSYDNGATWVRATRDIDANDSEAYDPFLVADRDTGRVYLSTLQGANSRSSEGCLQLIWSDDEGRSWSENPNLCTTGLPTYDHESFAAGKPRGPLNPEYPSLTYLCLNHAEGTVCATSLDGARSFRPLQPVFLSLNPTAATHPLCGGLNSPVETDHAGRVFVPRFHCDVPKLAVSEDGGLNWDTHVIPGPLLPREPVIGIIPYIDVHVLAFAVDAADNLHVLYSAGDGMPYYLYSRDHGVSWSSAREVAAPGVTAADRDRIAIAAGAEGHVALAYLATDHPGGYGTPNWTGARWHMKLGILTDAFHGGPIEWTQLNPESDPLGLNDCALGRCTECDDELCPGMYDYIGMQIAPDGRPWVAMVDVCHEECAVTGRHDRAIAAVGTLASGPSLRHPGQPLPALPLITWNLAPRAD